MNHNRKLRTEITAQHVKTVAATARGPYTITITATRATGGLMEEQQFLFDLIFKPVEPTLCLRPAETQLLLSYISEIPREVEAEEEKQPETEC